MGSRTSHKSIFRKLGESSGSYGGWFTLRRHKEEGNGRESRAGSKVGPGDRELEDGRASWNRELEDGRAFWNMTPARFSSEKRRALPYKALCVVSIV